MRLQLHLLLLRWHGQANRLLSRVNADNLSRLLPLLSIVHLTSCARHGIREPNVGWSRLSLQFTSAHLTKVDQLQTVLRLNQAGTHLRIVCLKVNRAGRVLFVRMRLHESRLFRSVVIPKAVSPKVVLLKRMTPRDKSRASRALLVFPALCSASAEAFLIVPVSEACRPTLSG